MTQLAETETTTVTATSHDRHRPGERDQSRSVAWGQHAINLRLSVPFLATRYYFAVVAGKERRSEERRVSERAKHPLDARGNVIVVLAASSIIGLALFGLQMMLGLWTFERLIVVQ